MVDGVQPILKSQSSCTLFVGVNADKALLLLGPLNTGDSDLAPPPNRCCCFSYSLFHFIDHSHVHMRDDWLLFTFISTLGTYLYDI